MQFFKKIGLILIIPFVILGFFIDIMIGDIMTGEKSTISEKAEQNKNLWVDLWRDDYT
tara:strand:+ start:446 stop:619 length:174 start_codon:yes stop_codon:yes gene_type:complete